MDSGANDPCGPGFPIRKSADQRLLSSPRGLSQSATSFIASQCQGIHQMPFKTLAFTFVIPGSTPGITQLRVRHKDTDRRSGLKPSSHRQLLGADQTTIGQTSVRLPLRFTMTKNETAPPPCGAPDLLLKAIPGAARPPAIAAGGSAWWAREDLNFRPHAYQARALTS